MIRQQTHGAAVGGYCDPKFKPVSDAFAVNFEEHGEIGASVCIKIGGRTVVDLWGGVRDQATGTPWTEETLIVAFSCTKAATALCAQVLVDRGALDLDAPVSRYWPEFAQAGKENASFAMMLNHTVGVPAIRERLKKGAFCDWQYMVDRLAAEEPFWQPGTKLGYHMFSFGWTVGELVRRVSGKSLGRFFREQIAGPLGIDFWIGLPAEFEDRLAPIIPFVPSRDTPPTEFGISIVTDPNSIPRLSLLNNGRFDANSRDAHAAQIGAAGGITNARGLAGMFEPLSGVENSGAGGLLSRTRVEEMRRVSFETDRDETLLIPTRFGQGFMLSMDNGHLPDGNSVVIGEGAFGHVGMGGSIGFADPECRMSFGYVMNKIGGGILLNRRGQSLVDAAYACL